MIQKIVSMISAVFCLFLCSACSESNPPSASISIKIMDVGDGDGILILGDQGSSLLIDTGLKSTYSTVKQCLEESGVKQLDMLVITHPHKDHLGGAMDVIGDFSPKAMYTVKTPHDSDELKELMAAYGEEFTYLQQGDVLTLDSVTLRTLSPASQTYDEINDYSAVFMMEYGEKRFLFTGDAEKTAEKEMLENYGEDLQADFLKVGHHGDDDATSKKFLAQVMPDFAAISGDHSQDPDHVTDKVLDKLAAVGCQVYRTDRDGMIVVSSDGKTISVSTEK